MQGVLKVKKQLYTLHSAALDSQTKERLHEEVQNHLSRLVHIDPLRRSRYEELQKNSKET